MYNEWQTRDASHYDKRTLPFTNTQLLKLILTTTEWSFRVPRQETDAPEWHKQSLYVQPSAPAIDQLIP